MYVASKWHQWFQRVAVDWPRHSSVAVEWKQQWQPKKEATAFDCVQWLQWQLAKKKLVMLCWDGDCNHKPIRQFQWVGPEPILDRFATRWVSLYEPNHFFFFLFGRWLVHWNGSLVVAVYQLIQFPLLLNYFPAPGPVGLQTMLCLYCRW